MNQSLVDKIVQAVLYEGYILYPYRPSVKNHHRWTFGGLYPRAYSEANPFGDAWSLQVQCLMTANAETVVNARVRFLHLTDRKVGQFLQPVAKLSESVEPACLPVASLQVNGKQYHRWQEAVERDITMPAVTLRELLDEPRRCDFAFEASRKIEPLAEADGQIVGILTREQQVIEGSMEASAMQVAEGVFKLTVRVWNRTPMEPASRLSASHVPLPVAVPLDPAEIPPAPSSLEMLAAAQRNAELRKIAQELSTPPSIEPVVLPPTRDEALMRSLVSTHAILTVRDGQFISMTDAPAHLQDAVNDCKNTGVWPVLVGEAGEKDTMLASPIILYDYPEIAPESPGDLFDGTEIDEILTLRVLTLTDAEKLDVAAVDDRAGAMLQRTEALAREQLMGLHGTVRGLRQTSPEDETMARVILPADDVLTARNVQPALNAFADGNAKPRWNDMLPGEVFPAWDVLENKPKLPSYTAGGVELHPGDRVRLRPRGGADAIDMLLAGKTATIASIEQDYEDRIHIAVTIEDDPGADFGVQGKPGHRFFFRPDEVEAIKPEFE